MKPESKSGAVIVPLPRPEAKTEDSSCGGTVSRGSETVPVDYRQLIEDLSRAAAYTLPAAQPIVLQSAALLNEMLRNLQTDNNLLLARVSELERRLQYYSDLEDYVVHVYPWKGDKCDCLTLHTLLEQAHTEDDRYVRRLNACGDEWCVSENCQGKGRHGE